FLDETFVVGATAFVDATLGVELRAQGETAWAIGPHASGPSANLNLDGTAFAGAKVTVGGVGSLGWIRKSREAHGKDLGEGFGRFLTFIGMPKHIQLKPDTATMMEIMDVIEWGEVGDVLIAAAEARAEGKAGAGAEAKAHAGMKGGVVEVKGGF